jgi:multicomponent Na+:H+ antiporter subunit E
MPRLVAHLTMLHALGATLVLFCFWLVLSGFFTPFLVAAGLGSALAVVWFTRRLQVLDREGLPLGLTLRVLPYWVWLLKEIVKSAWQVSRIILDPRLPISPTLVTFAPTQRGSVGLVIHANSITLTPGTITVDAEPGRFLVHALTRDGAAGAAGGDMDARVRACEERAA